MELDKAIKQLISENGIEFIRTKRFIYILDDMGAFKDEPMPSKKILRGLLESSFADLVCMPEQEKDASWNNAVNKSVSDYSDKSGYKDELVKRLAEFFIYKPTVVKDNQTSQEKLNKENPIVPESPLTPTVPATNMRRKKVIKPSPKKLAFILFMYRLGFIGLLIITIVFYLYLFSSDERKRYEVTMDLAAKELNRGYNRKALEHFEKAGKEYDAFFLSDHYRNKAFRKAEEVSEIIFENWKRDVNYFLENNMEINAKIITIDLPQNLMLSPTSFNVYRKITKTIDDRFDKVAPGIFEEVLTDLSENSGFLSPSGKARLSELIKCDPANYWYNLIWNKRK